jgi:alkylated DNA nucleotide flippase Atl1
VCERLGVVIAKETTLQELLEGSKQYRVPLYQRTYSWGDKQLSRLWADVEKLAEDRQHDPTATHFIGSVVLAPSPGIGPVGVQEFLVVDGQQRLTTLTLLLCAIRDHRQATEGGDHRQRLDELFLTNKYRPAAERPKVVPTQADRPAYEAVLDATPQAGGTDRVGAAYRHFRSQLVRVDDPDDPLDVERIEAAVVRGLSLVSVTAQPGDNAYRIFESLNNTGLALKQGDLLRNYLFMRLPTRGEIVYSGIWLPLQQALSADDLELLFWLDLVRTDSRAKQTEIYQNQQRRLERMTTEADVEAEVQRFARLGRLLRAVLDPTHEDDPAVRRRLQRLKDWGTTTVYPLALHLLDLRERGETDSAVVAQALLVVESFLVRRLLIGRATANINRVLLDVVTEMDPDLPVDEAVHRYLSSGRKYFAGDEDVRAALKTVPFYLNGRAPQRALLMRWIEETFDNREPVQAEQLTIEHVLPQTLTESWLEVLSEDAVEDEEPEDLHKALLHTLGNLTLTGYNSPLGNKPFDVKRVTLRNSGVAMTRDIAEQERWGRPEILARADRLADRICDYWPAPLAGVRGAGEPAWDVLESAVAALPAGSWTSYLDLAALIGSHQVPVGQRLATHELPNAHRVLKSRGVVPPGFRWVDPARTDDPAELLQQEGVPFDAQGRADQSRRMRVEELAVLVGLDPAELPEAVPDLDEDDEAAGRFSQQLYAAQNSDVADAVMSVLIAWRNIGGILSYGSAEETSVFLMVDEREIRNGGVWPAAVYPSGKFEVVFQWMQYRPPFDDVAVREQFRQRLNAVPGVNLPAVKLAMRPGFELAVLDDDKAQERLLEALAWFRTVATT